MNPEFERDNFTLVSMASTVFKPTEAEGGRIFEVTKTRKGGLVLGGKYTYDFVKVYAANNENVLIEEAR